jgi:anti-sigma regulatory factor (Ser/Thr protein kinase)
MHYAYTGGTGDAEVICEKLQAPSGLRITIRDKGKEFNPLNRAAPKLDVPAETRQIGGLGIYLIKQTMDTVRYRREDGYNVLTIEKYLPEQGAGVSGKAHG